MDESIPQAAADGGSPRAYLFLSFVIFAGSMTVVSLQNGLGTLENRLGADIIVVPNTAKRKVDPKTMILDGTPGYFTWNGKRWC